MAKHVIHAHSSVSTNGVPKLPNVNRIEYGEIAINYAASAETISFRNTSDELVQVKTDEYYQVKFDEINQTIEDNELVTASALNDLNTKLNAIPDEVFIGDAIEGTPDIFIDTTESEDANIEVYTKAQVDAIVAALEARIQALEN